MFSFKSLEMIVYYIAALLLISPAAQGHVDFQPQQVHIALGGNLTHITI